MNALPLAAVSIPYLLSSLSFTSGVSCSPYATLVSKDLQQDEPSAYLSPFSQQSDQVAESSSNHSRHHLNLGIIESRSLSTRRTAVPLVVSLVCVFSVLLILVTLKFSYLKQRRLQTIHDLPNLLEVISEEEEQDSLYDRPTSLPGSSQRASDPPSVHSRPSGRMSYRSSAASANNGTFSSKQRRPDSAPGFLVGFLGSPDWETAMQRTLADHHWRLRRESRSLSLKSPNRSTWHSHQTCQRSRNSTSRSQPTKEQPVYNPAGRHSSLRIPHVSSFGEMYADTFRGKKRRPKSLNTVVGRMSSSRSDSFQTCSFGLSLNPRPSTIQEAETPPPTLPLIQEGTFRLQVTDYSINTASSTKTASTSPVLEPSEQRVASLRESPNAEVLTVYQSTSASRDSSVGGSFSQLTRFPSPPATPDSLRLATPQFPDAIQVNTVHVAPRYLERFYNDALVWGDRKPGLGLGLTGTGSASNNALGSFSPLTVDFRCPALSELLVKKLLNMDPAIPGIAALTDRTRPSVGLDPLRNDKLPGPYTPGNLAQTAHLRTLSGSLQNRQHIRVREHAPFSLISHPPGHQRGPRERTVRFAFGDEEAPNGQAALPRSDSLVDLSTPTQPSPLKRIASMGSINSSCESFRMTMASGDVSKDSTAGVDDSKEHGAFMSKEDSRQGGDARDEVSSFVHELKPMLSNASLFLDLGGSSVGYEEEPIDFLSFDAVDFAGGGAEQSFEYSQASSSELIAVVPVGSDDEVESFVENQTEHSIAE